MLAGWLALLALLAVAGWVVQQRWDTVDQAGGLPGLGPSAAAVAVLGGANVVLAWNWRAVIALVGPRLPWRAALWVWSVSQLSRYTVSFAQVGSRAVLARSYGAPATAGVLSTLLELLWMVTVTSALVLATIPWWLPAVGDVRWLAWAALVPVAGLAAAMARPATAVRAIDWAGGRPVVARLTRGRLEGVASRVGLSRATIASFAARYGLNTALRHAAFLTLFAAVGGDLAARSDAGRRVGLAAGGGGAAAGDRRRARRVGCGATAAPAGGDRAGLTPPPPAHAAPPKRGPTKQKRGPTKTDRKKRRVTTGEGRGSLAGCARDRGKPEN
ncbi:MAG: hypothetical protein BRC32_05815 [Actinobacteria bacterium QS_8_72_14]|nr:MAG: hypothetical protein BRC32_05815 [Actinobacteria bacterium QS_8_72_14]